jgi:hypothetical protein
MLIDILKKYNVKTTFFVVGAWVDKYPDSVRALTAAGHEVCNHSSTHPHMPKLTQQEMTSQITSCNEKIKAITGASPLLFRPPYGDYNDSLINTVNGLKMYPIQWSVDSLDWKDPTPQQIASRVLSRVKPGSIVLFHNGAKNTPAALPTVLQTLQAQGYKIVPVSQLIYKSDYTIDSAGVQIPKSIAPKTSFIGFAAEVTAKKKRGIPYVKRADADSRSASACFTTTNWQRTVDSIFLLVTMPSSWPIPQPFSKSDGFSR